MTKFSVLIPICFITLSGCALFDNPEMSTVAAPASAPVAEEQGAMSAEPVQIAGTSDPVAAPPRSATTEDVRRLQMRLRDLGFDAGPVDGVAGVKTKKAFSRLQDGCAKLEPLSEKLPIAASHGVAADRVPGREDVVKIQRQLRGAGFDPGPIDGVYGSKTKSVVAQLPDACLMAREFPGTLEAPARTVKREISTALAPEGAKPAAGGQSTGLRHDGPGDAAAAQTAQASEDVRILQLRLRDAGFDPGPFDGVMGAKTKAALAQYEASQINKKVKTSLTTKKISGQY
jgi:peptidoglycan hydrolase-like protein with peptidoglycan-binding domain